MTGYYIGIGIGATLIVAALAALITFKYRKHKFLDKVKEIGKAAEVKINDDIQVWAKLNKFKFLNSSLYKYDKNKLFEVDSILITDRAIFVVEIKSIKGGVKGDAKDLKLLKVTANNEYEITNPITQNDRHINHITAILSDRVPMVSLIVFASTTTTIEIENIPGHALVMRHSELLPRLDEISKKLPPAIDLNNIRNIYKQIKLHQTTNKLDIKTHREIAEKGYK